MTSSKASTSAVRRSATAFAAALAAIALAACGGGGGGGFSGNTGGSGSTVAQQIAQCEATLPQASMSAQNQTTVVVDAGPCAYYTLSGANAASVQQVGAFNSPFTSVTICVPGTQTCQTIDHVLVDTGSSGLRIAASVLDAQINLPGVTVGGAQVYECFQFASGFSWGSVRQATVLIAGESTAAVLPDGIPVQVIGDSESITYPSSCASGYPQGTTAQDDVYSMQANGILGVGLYVQDCGSSCTLPADDPYYFFCSSDDCSLASGIDMPTAQQVANPVAYFTNDYQGVILAMDELPAAGSTTDAAATLTGYLTFGINTQAGAGGVPGSPGGNNFAAGSSLGAYLASSQNSLNSCVTSVGTTAIAPTDPINAYYNASVVDSGSNAVYMPIPTTDQGSPTVYITADTYGFYNPGAATAVGALIQGANGGADCASVANVLETSTSYTIENADNLFNTYANDSAFMGVAGPNAIVLASNTSGIDWGLPFFFGRSIVVGLEPGPQNSGTLTIGATSYAAPLWAF